MDKYIIENQCDLGRVATTLGTSRSLVARWISGSALPTYTDIFKMCKAFDVEPGEWFP